MSYTCSTGPCWNTPVNSNLQFVSSVFIGGPPNQEKIIVAGQNSSQEVSLEYSSDGGINWTYVQLSSVFTAFPNTFAYGNGIYLASINISKWLIGENNGTNWSIIDIPDVFTHNIIFNGTHFVALTLYPDEITGQYGICSYTSSDGRNWTVGNRIVAPDYNDLGATSFSLFFASSVNSQPRYLLSARQIGSSTGFMWSGTTLNTPLSSVTGPDRALARCVYGNGIFVGVAAGYRDTWTSSDGINWTKNENATSEINVSLTFAQERFLQAPGTQSVNLYISSDGVIWTQTDNTHDFISWNPSAPNPPGFNYLTGSNSGVYIAANDAPGAISMPAKRTLGVCPCTTPTIGDYWARFVNVRMRGVSVSTITPSIVLPVTIYGAGAELLYTPTTTNLPVTIYGAGTTTSTTIVQTDSSILLVTGTGLSSDPVKNNNTFLDSSDNNFTITRIGNTTQGSYSPFGADSGCWSTYFNGSSSNLVSTGNNALDFTGAYTIEMWFYLSENLTYKGSFLSYYASLILSSQPGGIELFINSESSSSTVPTSVGISPYYGSGVPALAANGLSMPLNTWHHVAVSRNASNITSIWLNGNRVATGIRSGYYPCSSAVRIGGNSSEPNYSAYLPGYISNLRVVKDSAVYDPTQTTITVPTTSLTAISGTSLLTCQNNMMQDGSADKRFITTNFATVSAFSPFTSSDPFDMSVSGGSASFESNDYITIPSDEVFSFSTGNFTVEAWVYPISSNDTMSIPIRIFRMNNGTLSDYTFEINNRNTITFFGASGSTTEFNCIINFNQWNHVAWTRNSGVLKSFLNGIELSVKSGSSNNSTNIINNLFNSLPAGDQNGTLYPTTPCYISNIRVIKGVSVYNESFNVPSEPVTKTSQTSLLLNAANAKIFDKMAKNDIITLGTAEITHLSPASSLGSIKLLDTNSVLLLPNSVDYNFGIGNFTIQAWVYTGGMFSGYTSGFKWVFGCNNYSVRLDMNVSIGQGPDLTFYTTAGTANFGAKITPDAWTHIAVVRSNNILYGYINGIQCPNTVSNNTNLNSGSSLSIGRDYASSSNSLLGYINDLRVHKSAVYTGNFTPPPIGSI